jgi:hypothetical protein
MSAAAQNFAQADPKYLRTESMTGRRIFEFKSYRDCQLFQFTVPIDTKVGSESLKTRKFSSSVLILLKYVHTNAKWLF